MDWSLTLCVFSKMRCRSGYLLICRFSLSTLKRLTDIDTYSQSISQKKRTTKWRLRKPKTDKMMAPGDLSITFSNLGMTQFNDELPSPNDG